MKPTVIVSVVALCACAFAAGLLVGKKEFASFKRVVVVDTVKWEQPPSPVVHRVQTVKQIQFETREIEVEGFDDDKAIEVREVAVFETDTVVASVVRKQVLSRYAESVLRRERKPTYDSLDLRFLKLPTRTVETLVVQPAPSESLRDRFAVSVLASNRGFVVALNYRLFSGFYLGAGVAP